MEVLAVFLAIIIIALLLSTKNGLSSKIDFLNLKLEEMQKEIKKLQSLPKPQEPTHEPTRVEILTGKKAVEPVIEKPLIEEKVEVQSIFEQKVYTPSPEPSKPKPQEVKIPQPPIPPPPPKPGFFERNPDLEKFIGENLANKIGIAILVLGIGFFVKYAIDQNWINEIGRVFIGILCGGILLGVAHKLRNTFKAFSSVLIGGGIAVLYFTIAIAFHEYGIFSQTAAFMIMVIITAFAVLLSLSYNRMELAVLSALGGFATPFMVSTGEGNYVVLFTYLAILNVGMLVLAYFKKWNVITLIAYAFTLLIYGAWLGTKFDSANYSMIIGAISFASLFFFIFFLMNIINNIKERSPFQSLDIALILSNSFFYFTAGMIILKSPNALQGDYQGLFTAILGVINFAFAITLYKNKSVDKNLVYLLIGLVLTFISLAAPIQLQGNHITLFWAAEGVLLLWLSQKSGIKLIKFSSIIINLLMIISLIMDWSNLYYAYSNEVLSIIFNQAYVTGAFAIISLSLTLRLLRSEPDEYFLSTQSYRNGIVVMLFGVFYLVHLLELRYQLNTYYTNPDAAVIIGCYNMLFILSVLLIIKRTHLPEVIKGNISFIGFFALGSYLFYYFPFISESRNNYLQNMNSTLGFSFHYILVVLLIAIITLSWSQLKKRQDLKDDIHNAILWLCIGAYIFIASSELDTHVLLASYSEGDLVYEILETNHKVGFPILWGLASFILIALGFKKSNRQFRILSLTLFLITLIKLFVFDLRNISEGGKIAAFIFLGIVLLTVSFMYQRLKKLLLDDQPEKPEDKEL